MTKIVFLWFLLLPVSAFCTTTTFSDSELKKILTESKRNPDKNYLIYTWSPHMVLSIRGLEELEQSKANTHLFVIPILDPDANKNIATEIATKNKWPQSYLTTNQSDVLIRRGTRVHYPSYNFVRAGKFKGPLLPGYKTETQQNVFMKRYLK